MFREAVQSIASFQINAVFFSEQRRLKSEKPMTLVIGRRFDDLTYLVADTSSYVPLTKKTLSAFTNPLAKILVSKDATIAYAGNTFHLPSVYSISNTADDCDGVIMSADLTQPNVRQRDRFLSYLIAALLQDLQWCSRDCRRRAYWLSKCIHSPTTCATLHFDDRIRRTFHDNATRGFGGSAQSYATDLKLSIMFLKESLSTQAGSPFLILPQAINAALGHMRSPLGAPWQRTKLEKTCRNL